MCQRPYNSGNIGWCCKYFYVHNWIEALVIVVALCWRKNVRLQVVSDLAELASELSNVGRE